MGNLSEHFDTSEFACSCGCGYGTREGDVSENLIDLLEEMRYEYGPIRLTSGCRCAQHNAAVGGVANSAHTRGTAVDIFCSGLVDLAVVCDAAGIGVARGFVHVDVCDVLSRPSCWSY
jgi:uncharacterized protein YcbK (DUF882 family)